MRIEAKVVGHEELDPNGRLFLDHVSLRDADYRGLELRSFGAYGSRFERCHFDSMRLNDVCFGSGRETSEYVDSTFDGLRFSHSSGGFARFVRCSFRNVVMRDWICFRVELIDCIFTGRLQKCIFNGTIPAEDRPWAGRERNEFRGNDFSGAELIDVAFRTGIDLNLQLLPTGPDYLYVPDAEAAIERAKRGLVGWKPDTEFQRLARVIVTVEANSVADGQKQLLLNLAELRDGRRKYPREVIDKVVSLFRGDEVV